MRPKCGINMDMSHLLQWFLLLFGRLLVKILESGCRDLHPIIDPPPRSNWAGLLCVSALPLKPERQIPLGMSWTVSHLWRFLHTVNAARTASSMHELYFY